MLPNIDYSPIVVIITGAVFDGGVGAVVVDAYVFIWLYVLMMVMLMLCLVFSLLLFIGLLVRCVVCGCWRCACDVASVCFVEALAGVCK